METKTALKMAMLFCSVYQDVFGHLPTIPDRFGRFKKSSEDSRRCPKTTEVFQRDFFRLYFRCDINLHGSHVKEIFFVV